MTPSISPKVFPPLESDPALFSLLLHKLGASPALHFTDVLSLDDPPKTAIAYVLIAPSNPGYDEALQHEESRRIASLPQEQGKAAAPDVIWLKQTIHNACGFYALLHAAVNIPSAASCFAPGSFLASVLGAKTPEERRVLLETSKALEEAYIEVALQGQTKVADDWAWEPPWHYVAFVGKDGRVWELNGSRMGPVNRGAGGVAEVVTQRVKEQGEGQFCLLALLEDEE